MATPLPFNRHINNNDIGERLLDDINNEIPDLPAENIHENANNNDNNNRVNNNVGNNNRRVRRIRFRCGINEIRMLYIMGPLLMVIFFTFDQIILGFLLLSLLSVIGIIIIFRLLVLAKFRAAQQIQQQNRYNALFEQGLAGNMDGVNNIMRDLLNLNPTAIRLAMMDRDFTPNDYELLLRLDEEHKAQSFTGIPQSQIDRLPVFKMKANSTTTNTEDNNCSICLEPKLEGEEIRVIPCLHQYHKQCIDVWLKSNSMCPVCKHKISLPN